jgi:hypothetical protein
MADDAAQDRIDQNSPTLLWIGAMASHATRLPSGRV